MPDQCPDLDLSRSQQALTPLNLAGKLATLDCDLAKQRDDLPATAGKGVALLLHGNFGALHRGDGQLALFEDIAPQMNPADKIIEAGRRQGHVQEAAGRRLVHGNHSSGQGGARCGKLVAGQRQLVLVSSNAHIDDGQALGCDVVARGNLSHLCIEGGQARLQLGSLSTRSGDRLSCSSRRNCAQPADADHSDKEVDEPALHCSSLRAWPREPEDPGLNCASRVSEAEPRHPSTSQLRMPNGTLRF